MIKTQTDTAPKNGHAQSNYERLKTVISVRPMVPLFLDGIPGSEEVCTIVWREGRREVKFVNRSCPYHKRVLCHSEPG